MGYLAQRMKSETTFAQDRRRVIRVILLAMMSSALCDLPFRVIQLFDLAPIAGPKNMLPLFFGLLYGPSGAVGTALGALLSGLVRGQFNASCAAEAFIAFLSGSASWLMWYLLPTTTRPGCKQPRQLLFLLLCILVASGVAALSTWLMPTWGKLKPSVAAMQVGCSTLVWTVVLGIPCLITAASFFGKEINAPPFWVKRNPYEDIVDLEQIVENDPMSIGMMSDEIDIFNLQHNLPTKLGYAVMSCVEELNCLILEHLPPEGTVRVRLTAGDNVLLRLNYEGEMYNPLAIHVQHGNPTADMDVIGILMVREMAVHTSHWYAHGINEVKIII